MTQLILIFVISCGESWRVLRGTNPWWDCTFCYSGYSLHSVLCISEHFLQTFSRSTGSLLFQCCSWWILSFDENFSGLCFSRSLGISALVCCYIVTISSWWVDANSHRCVLKWLVQMNSSTLALKKVSFDPFIQTKYFSPSTAAPGQSSRAGWRAKISPVAPPALAQDKVIVGSGAHCIKHVGFVGYLELCGKKRSKVPFSFLHLQD